MPYEAKADGSNYQVVNSDTGDVKATHEPPDAKVKAERQAQLLNEVDDSWDEKSDG